VPEGPAVAGFRALRHCAHAVDRADLVVVEARGEMMTKTGAATTTNTAWCTDWSAEDRRHTEYRDSALREAVLGAFPKDRAQMAP
jgi:hypothetical protein